MSTSILLPDDLHADLKALAEREQRSLHRQIIWILQRYRDEQRGRLIHPEQPADQEPETRP